MAVDKKALFLLRCALAFSFAYAAVQSFREPQNWIGWFPPFMLALSPFTPDTTLALFSVVELALAALLLSGKWGVPVAIVSGAMLLGIAMFNLGAIDIVFRDIALALAAFALAVLERRGNIASS